MDIQQQIRDHHKVFMTCVDKLKLRGAKNYGLEGKMQEATRTLAGSNSPNPLALLNLHRYEKDFFLHKDMDYVDKVQQQADRLLEENRQKSNSLKPKEQQEAAQALAALQKYLKHFGRLVQIEQEIGLHEKDGLKADIARSVRALEQSLHQLDEFTDENIDILMAQSQFTIVTFFAALLFYPLFLACFFLPGWLTQSLILTGWHNP
ncbi:MAG: hypothetical protein HC880_12710 [Bacteroidia bacterium]|nr:hypothetical protein [Bacteroidia bacterium]